MYKRQRRQLKDEQEREELVFSRPFPPYGNPLWAARGRAPRGAFLVNTENDDFLFRMSFCDCDMDQVFETPNNRLSHAWNPLLLHSPQLSPTTSPPQNHPKLFLYWLRNKRPRDKSRFDNDDLPNLQLGTVLTPDVPRRVRGRFPQVRDVNSVDNPISAQSAKALVGLRQSNTALRLLQPADMHPVMNACMLSTDTAGMRAYQAAGVCLVRYEIIRFEHSTSTSASASDDSE